MQNLRYKLLFIVCALFTGVQTLLGVNASEHYTFYTREFLRNLGARNSAAVPVRKISVNDRFYGTAAGYSDGTTIHLNEDMFENHSESTNLFTCAHEAAHHALRHAFQVHRDTLVVEQEADETAARMLCTHGYRWVLEERVDLLRRLVNNGQGSETDGLHPTTQEEYVYLRRVLEANGAQNRGGERNPEPVRNADRVQNTNNRAGRERNRVEPARNTGPARNNNADRERNNIGRAGRERNNPEPARNPDRDQNADRGRRNNNPVVPERSWYRSGVAEFKDLINQFNDLSREQKIVIAGIFVIGFMR